MIPWPSYKGLGLLGLCIDPLWSMPKFQDKQYDQSQSQAISFYFVPGMEEMHILGILLTMGTDMSLKLQCTKQLK